MDAHLQKSAKIHGLPVEKVLFPTVLFARNVNSEAYSWTTFRALVSSSHAPAELLTGQMNLADAAD